MTRSFSNNGKNPNGNQPENGWDRRQMTDRYPSEHLEDFDEAPQNSQQTNSNEQGSIDDNVIIGNNINTKPTTTTEVDHGFLGQVLRVMGMDTGKIGALAVNGIIFIAQMVGSMKHFFRFYYFISTYLCIFLFIFIFFYLFISCFC